MGLAFIDRPPTEEEVTHFCHMLSTFRDGSGNEKEPDGTTRAGWRQIERCVAELVGAQGGEDKSIFDVIGIDETNPKLVYGFSVKSKQLDPRGFEGLAKDGRVYMEIANSPAKFWAELQQKHGVTEQDFRNKKDPQRTGDTIINLVETWHKEGKAIFEINFKGIKLDLTGSCYLCVSYSKESKSDDRKYQVHVFDLAYPKAIVWEYKSAACLSGYDPANKGEVLLDWYGLSGGQLKYYPKAKTARFATKPFKLERPTMLSSLKERARVMFQVKS